MQSHFAQFPNTYDVKTQILFKAYEVLADCAVRFWCLGSRQDSLILGATKLLSQEESLLFKSFESETSIIYGNEARF